jgi:hypothetical protein
MKAQKARFAGKQRQSFSFEWKAKIVNGDR